jgi:2-amino-4-hydroxy-6-hydroxymethyldihydropteridine diphosphokinase
MTTTTYAIALGSNRRGGHGSPAREVRAARDALGGIIAWSGVIATPPVGPSIRAFANAAALIDSDEDPAALLVRLKAIERAFGRRAGRRWGARVIDLDIILWSGGVWASPGLIVPHIAYRTRGFVLRPLLAIAPDWRDPIDNLTIRQIAARIDRRTPRT